MIQKLRILFLPKWYPNKFDSLDGNFVENHAKAIAPYCDIAILFVHSDPDLKQKFVLEETKPFGYSEIRLYFRKPKSGIALLDKILTSIRYFKAQQKGYKYYLKNYQKPDYTHIHVLSRTAPLALFLHYFQQVPFFITEHWSGYQKSNGIKIGGLKKWLSRKATKNAKGISTVSKGLSEAMQARQMTGNYNVIPNVIDTALFKPIPKKNEIPRFIHISNLSKSPKNLHNIIKNLSEVAISNPNFEFILIGYGEEQDEMLELIDNSTIKKQTTFKGKLSNQEVAAELAKSDALLLFSLYENQPCVILEAFSCGCPVITSDVGGISEFMNPDLGYLVESENNEQFKQAVSDFLDKKRNLETEFIRNYALNHFSEEVVGKAFLDFYQNNKHD